MSLTPCGQDKFISVNHLQLHYVEWGMPGNPPIVLLHGFQSNAHTWDTFSLVVPWLIPIISWLSISVVTVIPLGHRMATMLQTPLSVILCSRRLYQ